MTGFGFTSHWSRNWLEIFVPTAKRSKGKPKQMLITFDTQVETALISRFGCASSKFDEACGLQAIPHRKLTVFVPREAESKEGVSLANQKLFSLPAVFYIFYVFYFSYILYLVFLLIYRPRYQRQNDNNTQGRETPLAAYTNTSSNLMLRDETPAFLQSPRPGDALNRENQPGPVSPDQEYMPLTPVTKSGNWEITREHVQVVRMIGKGAFAQVAKALAWNISGVKGVTTVAVKMLKEDAPYSDRQDLLSELELMKKLKPHPHVIKLMGCITETEPLLVLIEYIPYGDLLGYLRKSRGLNDMYFEDPDVKPETQLTSQQLMRFCQQIADGMSYLCSKKIIHRDLAARNVLVGEGEKCKVTDFGMARNVHQDDFYTRQSQGRLPVKWTAYEGLLYGTYTTQSDVWSFGVVLYEIFTVGGSPYPRINGREIVNKLQQGYRMPKPKHVDEQLYQIMLQCWQQNPNDRPTFSMLKDAITEMAQNKQDTYVNMKEYDTSLYSNVEDLFV